MVQIKVNKNKIISAKIEGDHIYLDNIGFDGDIKILDNQTFNIIRNNKVFNATIVQKDPANKKLLLKVNGQLCEMELKDNYDLLLETLGMSSTSIKKVNDLKAPMPGLIVRVNVAVGQVVKEGEPLLILEAMKMENILKSPYEAEVKEVFITQGQTVEKNQILIKF